MSCDRIENLTRPTLLSIPSSDNASSDKLIFHPEFCTQLWQICVQNQYFLSSILFTNETIFTRNGVQNFQNVHVMAYENPQAVFEPRSKTTL